LLAKTPPCGPPGNAAIFTPEHHFSVGFAKPGAAAASDSAMVDAVRAAIRVIFCFI
jgi:hypothetical protein